MDHEVFEEITSARMKPFWKSVCISPAASGYEFARAYQYGPCWRRRPELTSNFRSTWITPWDASISLLWRYTSKVTDLDEHSQRFDLPSTDYFDLAAVWGPTENLTLRMGINNLLDEDPPICPCGSGNTIPESFDALGQYIFAGINFRQ
jgi:iron complex outermembrane receptor protein